MEKSLKFIHITKTGGTSIEDCAIKKNVRFGRFHAKYYTPDKRGAQHHTFFHYLPESIQTKFDWFAVVRNPYDRILSEYHCKWGGGYDYGIKNNYDNKCATKMNKYIQNAIINRLSKGGHYSEQYKYFDKPSNVKIHILKFENLKDEFNDLMQQYNMDIQLNKHHNKTTKRFSVSDFSKQTIEMINTIYEPDFRLFGYDMIK
jgi:hypothetical protein